QERHVPGHRERRGVLPPPGRWVDDHGIRRDAGRPRERAAHALCLGLPLGMSVLSARRRAALVVALVAAWVAGSALGATQPARRASAAPLFQLEPAHAEFVPVLDGSKPIYVLVIGSDARPDQAVESQRADSIHILSINPAEHKAAIVGIPRDSYVGIPAAGTNKINTALFD